jgi:ubiquinone/menaquinone biosynthesis C-methylase UbiE
VSIAGIDPSAAMLADARRRNRASIESGSVELVQTTADTLIWGDSSFDGAVAVNSMQMWDPLDVSLGEVTRVLRPGGRLVTLTHGWAIERSTGRSPDVWAEWVRKLAIPVGFTELESWRARSEQGKSVALTLTKRIAR